MTKKLRWDKTNQSKLIVKRGHEWASLEKEEVIKIKLKPKPPSAERTRQKAIENETNAIRNSKIKIYKSKALILSLIKNIESAKRDITKEEERLDIRIARLQELKNSK